MRNPGLHKLPKLTLNSLENKGWAELSGPAIKAAPTRAAAPFFAQLALEYFNSESVADRNTCRVTSKLAEFYDIIASASMFPSVSEQQKMKYAIDDMGIALQTLRSFAQDRHELVWHDHPKAHKAMRLPLFASIINPRYVNCYASESQVGTCQKVWRSSVKGKYGPHVQRNVLAKRWLALLLRLDQLVMRNINMAFTSA